MSLKIQIISILFSIIYGIMLYIIFNKIKRYFYVGKRIYIILNSLLFMLIITIVYFYIFNIINNGVINIYFILITVIIFLYLNYIRFTKKM